MTQAQAAETPAAATKRPTDVMTMEQVRRYWGCSKKTVYDYAHARKFKLYRKDGVAVADREEIERLPRPQVGRSRSFKGVPITEL